MLLPLFCFNQVEIRILDPTVSVKVLAEVCARHRLVQLPLNQRLIGLAHQTTGVGVGRQKNQTERRRAVVRRR
jgi:hypothetical protein